MASIARLIEDSPTELVTIVKRNVREKRKVQDISDKLTEAFSKPEMSELINLMGDRKGHKSVLAKAVSNFEAMTTYEYRVLLDENKTRRAYANELREPNEFLIAKSKLHAGAKLYKKYALVLWIATGYSGYAKQAGYTIQYIRAGSKVVNDILEVVFAHEKELLDAMEWWESAIRRKEVLDVLSEAQAYVKKINYRETNTKQIKPYIEWEAAAKAVVGMHMTSSSSSKSARKLSYGNQLRPDEKAQFIRDYIEAERKTQGVLDGNSIREIEGVCLQIESLVKQYTMFDTDKTRSIIATLRRANFTRVTERQREYLLGVLKDMQDYKDLKEKNKVGADLFDVDKFFNDIVSE